MCYTFVWTINKHHKDTNGAAAVVLFLAGKL